MVLGADLPMALNESNMRAGWPRCCREYMKTVIGGGGLVCSAYLYVTQCFQSYVLSVLSVHSCHPPLLHSKYQETVLLPVDLEYSLRAQWTTHRES